MRQGPFLLGLFLVTGSSLALEVLDTRLLSVITWYSLAFLVIAMGLFGLTAGAVHVYLKSEDYTGDKLAPSLARDARWLSWAVPLSYVLLLIVPLRTEFVATTVVLFVAFSAAIALPFYPAGRIVAAAVTRTPFPVGRVYAVDLLGAAVGAPLVPLIIRAGGGTAILSMAVVGALASACFAWAGGARPGIKRAGKLAAGMLALCLLNSLSHRGLVPLWAKGMPENRDIVDQEMWNSHSRVQVMKEVRAPAIFWGRAPKCGDPLVLQRNIVIDGHAATPLYLEPLDKLGFLSCDVTNVVHAIRPHGPVAIIGVGGSRDIQAALKFGHSPVVGIEFNDRLLQILRSPLAAPTGIAERPDVTLVHDEARSWLARSHQQFEVIQASLIDTWAATGAGAHALGENGLYTVDAWRVFLNHLSPGGILTVSRWATVETGRLVALASAALLDRGVKDPGTHIALVNSGPVNTLLVGRDPLTPDDERQLNQVAFNMGFVIMASPHHHPSAKRLDEMLWAHSRAELDQVALRPLLDFRPPTDDRPFFFNVIRLSALWHPLPAVTRGTIEGNLLATRALGLAFLASLILVIGAIYVPLSRRAKPTGHTGRGLWAALLYFGTIGVGFMLAEIALLQRLSVVLGEPEYSLIVVLSSLVGFAGIGSLVSDRLPLSRAPWCYVYPLLLATAIAAVALVWPHVAAGMEAAPLGTRIGFSVGMTAAVGLPLGLAFPAGLRMAREAHGEETPWLWGINGMGSVLASSAAILIALVFGLTQLMLVSAGCYVLLVVAVAGMQLGAKRVRESAGDASDEPLEAEPEAG